MHGAGADLSGDFPDADGEDEHVEAVHRGAHPRHAAAEPVQIYLPGEFRPFVPGAGAGRDLAHVAGTREPVQAGPVLQGGGEFSRRHSGVLLEPQHQAGVDRS